MDAEHYQSERYAIDEGGARLVEVAWRADLSAAKVSVDGQDVGGFASHAEFMEGRAFDLPGGGQIFVQWVQRVFSVGPRVVHNGVECTSTTGRGANPARSAFNSMAIVGALYIGLWLVVMLSPLYRDRADWTVGALGAVLVLLAIPVRAGRRAALAAAIALLALDTVARVVIVLRAGGSLELGGLLLRAYLVFTWSRHFHALAKRAHNASAAPRPYRSPAR